jgi:amino acid transporter
VIGLAGVVWLLDGNPSATDFGTGWDPFAGEELALGLPYNLTFFSFAILALLGIETPLNLGVEVEGGEKAIRTYLLWGCVIVMAAYLWTTWGNMVVIEAGGANGVTGGAQAVGVAIGEWAGVIVAVILAWVFLTATVVYNYAFARLLFVSGLERRLPHQVGKVNKNRVPANAVILQSVIATIITVFVFFGLGGDDYNKPFYGLYAGLTIVWCISTALLFLDIFFAKRADPERFEKERRVPVWFLYACGVVGTIINIAAVLFIFVGSWYPAGFPTLTEWNTWMFSVAGISVAAGIIIYLISQRARKGKTDEELIVLGAAEQEIKEDLPTA